MIFVWIICIMLCRCAFVLSETQTQYGPIEGKPITLFNGKKVEAFLGVPYAAPPIGLLRFASPQPPKHWNTTLETKTLSKSCFQSIEDKLKPVYWFLAKTPESEDCLYLNVWRPMDNDAINLPVMIWIHGGAYIGGSASIPVYDGSVLASQNGVIVVSINFRMDLWGFLYMNSSQVDENVGLQDQIQAIKWVKENIQNFGGDPTRITLFGVSSGGLAVAYHMLNLQVSDLFRNGIIESGIKKGDIGSLPPADAYTRSKAVAEKVGCFNEDVQKMMTCLRNQSPQDLLKGVGIMYEFVTKRLRPVRNGIEVPVDLNTAAQKVPETKRKNVMIGNSPMEGGYILTCIIPQEEPTVDVNVTEEVLNSVFTNMLQLGDSRLQRVLLHEYKNFSSTQYDPDEIKKELGDIIGDMVFTCTGISFAESYLSESNNVYYYYFEHKPSRPIDQPTPEWMGIIHGDDVPFVFGVPLIPDKGYTDDEKKLSKNMMTLWTNFVKTDNPNSEGGEKIWPALKPNGTLDYLGLDITFRLGTNLKGRECNFWESIYPQLTSLQMQLDGKKQ